MRICTKKNQGDQRLSELKELLLARQYPEQLIDAAQNKARKIPRKIALRKVIKKITQNRPIFCLKYDPRLPSIQAIQSKHWRSMTTQNQYLKEVFKEPPMTAFRRQTNIRDILIKSKVPQAPNRYPTRIQKGMSKCG